MTHALYVVAAYGISALALIGLVVILLRDQHAQKSGIAELEASGVRRRSDKSA